jgi:hypothetical protein
LKDLGGHRRKLLDAIAGLHTAARPAPHTIICCRRIVTTCSRP